MNYYDELGVSAHATPEEIKEAYRALMRLLHPDHHPDPQLQHVAEQQAKKLNGMYGILSDPERRRLYDRELAEGVERSTPVIIHAPPPPRRGVFNRSSAAWVSAVTLFAILLIWMASRPIPTTNTYNRDSGASLTEPASRVDAGARLIEPGEPILQPPPQRAQPAPVAVASNGDSQVLKNRLAETQGERDAALAELTRLQSRLAAEKASAAAQRESHESRQNRQRELAPAAPPAEIKPELKPAEKPVLTAKIAPVPPPPDIPLVIRNPIAGSWTYRKPAMPPKNKDLYPPEFIETTITEENGQLRGTYHARYQVPNRPVSPEVSFQFAGKMSGDSGSLPWNGVGGSKGEVTLKLTADHSLKVDWTASQLGPLGFYRGTAVLVKKSD
jgi:curved DNA-binding protein CbpA